MAELDWTLAQLAMLHTRMDTLQAPQAQGLAQQYDGMNQAVLDHAESFTGTLDDLQQDRSELGMTNGLGQLFERLDALQQSRIQEQHQRREQGMGM